KQAARRTLRSRVDTLIAAQREAADARDTARGAARDANRRALHLAGPPEQWDTVLTRSDPEPSTGTTDTGEAIDIAHEIRDRTDDIHHQLTQLHDERLRRAALTPD